MRIIKLISSFIFLLIILFATTVFAATDQIKSKPGDVFKVIIKADPEIESIRGTFLGRKIKFFKVHNKFRGIFPSMPEKKPGRYSLTLEVSKQNGVLEKFHRQVNLKWKKFPSVYFTLKPSKQKLRRADLIAREWSEIEKVLIVERSEQLWERRFVLPVPGIITMDYGRREYVNKKRSGSHRGVDFRAAIGTPVKASNHGIVVLAKHYKAFGGTMVIDHGQGVHSLYFHLSKFLVPVGTRVQKGQLVAKSGNSGISSGPHLHWGLSVHNVRINPLQWTTQVM